MQTVEKGASLPWPPLRAGNGLPLPVAGERKPSPNHPTKKSNRLKTVGHLYKMRFQNDSSILLLLRDTTKKTAHDIFFVMGLCLDVTKMIPRKLGCQFVSVQSLRKVGHPYKTCAINCLSILQFLSDTTKKKVHDIFSVMDSNLDVTKKIPGFCF